MNIGHNHQQTTSVHGLDPRVKLLCMVAFSCAVAVVTNIRIVLVALVISVILVYLSGPHRGRLIRHIIMANGFIAVLWLFIPFTHPGETMFFLGPLKVTKQGIDYAFLITARSNAIIITMAAYGATTPVTDTVHALSRLHLPGKFVYLFFLTYRYIFEIMREYSRIKDAMKIRCFIPGTNMHTYKSYAYLIGMLLVNSYERAQRVRLAMICRGFDGRFVSIDTLSISRYDIIMIIISSMVITGLLINNAG